jgi:hypothetical protein
LEEIGGKLSEVRATSDRFRGNRRKAVQSKRKFGQVWRKPEKSCTKSEQVWTGLEETEEKLSEERGSSDRFGGSWRKAVRSQSKFGQVWRKPVNSCPK